MLEYLRNFCTELAINIFNCCKYCRGHSLLKVQFFLLEFFSLMKFEMEKTITSSIMAEIFSFLSVHLPFFYNNRTPVLHLGTQLLRLSVHFSSTLTTGCDRNTRLGAMECKRKWCVQLLSLDVKSWILFVPTCWLEFRVMVDHVDQDKPLVLPD